MDRRSVRPNGAGSRRSHEPPVAGDTEFRKVVGATRTVTLTNSQLVLEAAAFLLRDLIMKTTDYKNKSKTISFNHFVIHKYSRLF